MIQIRCPKCSRWFASDVKTGQMGCPDCGHVFVVGGAR
jgi:DNA-directed RNA polymerase subunit RPC12/RpoP